MSTQDITSLETDRSPEYPEWLHNYLKDQTEKRISQAIGMLC
jgi:hypothetical protein